MTTAPIDQSDRYCVFRSGGTWYGLPALAVREVGFCPQVTGMPRSAPFVVGLCQLRNEFLPVLNMRELTGDAGSAADDQSTLLVVEAADGPCGLLVDCVAGLQSLDVSVSPAADEPEAWAAVVGGWASYDQQSVQILDPIRFSTWVTRAVERDWCEPVLHLGEGDVDPQETHAGQSKAPALISGSTET